MCGRFALGLAHDEVVAGIDAEYHRLFPDGGPRWEREQDFRPNYNIAPRQRSVVVRRDERTGEAMLETMQWGLIPHWTKHPPTGTLNTINARSEAIIDPTSGGMWHALKAHKRCLVPAQGYFEWQKRGSSKIAHFTRLPLQGRDRGDGGGGGGGGNTTTPSSPRIIFFAGLWDTVKYVSPVESKYTGEFEPYPTGNPVPLSTFTILTTTPAPDLAWLHDRMPCVLTDEADARRWLDLGQVKGWQEGKGGTADVLKSAPGLESYPVAPEVGKIGHSQASYILPVSERSDGIKSFFQKQSPRKNAVVPTPVTQKKKKKSSDDGGEEPGERWDGAGVETSPGQKPSSPTAARVKSGKDSKQLEPETVLEREGKPTPTQTQTTDRSEDDDDRRSQPTTSKPNLELTCDVDPAPSTEDVVAIADDDTIAPATSNSQEPASEPGGKRKREQGGSGGDLRGSRARGRGVRQTKVVRTSVKVESPAQPSITSFFKSPRK